MKMCLIALVCMPILAGAVDIDPQDMALLKARKSGAKAKEVFRVVDMDGNLMPGVKFEAWLQTGFGMHDAKEIRGVADENGMFTVEGRVLRRMAVRLNSPGYYETSLDIDYGRNRGDFSDGKWLPYGRERTAVLKKIVNPCLERTGGKTKRKIPAYGEWFGYDLEKLDWVKPFGEGECNDVMMRFWMKAETSWRFEAKMEISFAHEPYAGFYRRKKDTWSEFQTEYRAETNDVYKSAYTFCVNTERVAGRVPERIWDHLQEDEYLVFRVRTKVNEKGELVSARYGRIDGPWLFHQLNTIECFKVYLNPSENETNLEDTGAAKAVQDRLSAQADREEREKKRKWWPF